MTDYPALEEYESLRTEALYNRVVRQALNDAADRMRDELLARIEALEAEAGKLNRMLYYACSELHEWQRSEYEATGYDLKYLKNPNDWFVDLAARYEKEGK